MDGNTNITAHVSYASREKQMATRRAESRHSKEETMMTMFDYTQLLTTLQQIAPEAHIAGGAVRDTILEKTIHDIDVFMDDKHVEPAAKLLRSTCCYVKVGEWKEYLGFSDPAMTRVAKFEKHDEEIPVCIIGLRRAYANPRANIERFDFGYCMVAFDGTDTIRTTEFDRDAESRQFTLLRADNWQQFAYSMSRYEKITAGRYSGWSLAIPDEFQEFAKQHTFERRYYHDYDGGKFVLRENLIRPKERMAA